MCDSGDPIHVSNKIARRLPNALWSLQHWIVLRQRALKNCNSAARNHPLNANRFFRV